MPPITRRNWFTLTHVAILAVLPGCVDRPLWGTLRTETALEKMAPPMVPAQPSRFVIAAEPLIIHSDQEMAADSPTIREIRSLRFRLTDMGVTVPEEPVHIYLFNSEPEFLAYAGARVPGFAERHAFFAQSSDRLEVYTFLSDELPNDLRHEVMHGYLHAANPHVPLWLDEGLAEYVEVPAEQRGRHPEHEQTLRCLTSDPLQPMPDAELEREITVLAKMNEPATMSVLDYARCWRVVRQLLQTETGRQRLRRTANGV